MENGRVRGQLSCPSTPSIPSKLDTPEGNRPTTPPPRQTGGEAPWTPSKQWTKKSRKEAGKAAEEAHVLNHRDYEDETGRRKTPHRGSPLASMVAATAGEQGTAMQPSTQTEDPAAPSEHAAAHAERREQGELPSQTEGTPNEGSAQNGTTVSPGSPMELTEEIPPFVFPEPMDPTEFPTLTDENPHLQVSQRWPSPTKTPTNWTTPFTQAVWPRAVFSTETLLRNVCEKHRVDIEDAQTETLLAIFFGAGPANNAKHPDQVKRLLEVLETLQSDLDKTHEGEEGYAEVDDAIDAELAEPKRKSEGDREQRPFNSPWIVILKIARAEVRNFLVHRQTMAWDKTLTAHFVTLDLSVKSWVIAHLQCNAVKDTVTARMRMLASIKKALWADKVYRKTVDIITSPSADFIGNLDERVYESTRTLDLVYVAYMATTGERAGKQINLYILLGKPLTSDPDLHKRWVDAIRKGNLRVGIQTVRTREVYTDCEWCKSPMHPTEACAYFTVNDWYGPRQQDSPIRGQQSTRGGRSRGRGRGGTRGRGARGGNWGNRFDALDM
ncbi:hypothetical protein FISHEDRAFT_70679 [Fistulina hepatica ATCC 64428]|uniref:Uncharacterized protein n=1 Tax=Fistulina hepatica ATCC 64428 TaxID=1128425 RepID=A0A0D7AHU9_9AGAR|nr:hypothetical protein FISHEDRAFT_72204 [Fistulina hepatica ATCC 64428]KIY51445.1 hypothetical protein FISHEDRAFT_70679 [Fistulina hepatica ATCC 64428]